MKKILFGLLGIISLGLINFSSAVSLPSFSDYHGFDEYSLSFGQTYDISSIVNSNGNNDIFCFDFYGNDNGYYVALVGGFQFLIGYNTDPNFRNPSCFYLRNFSDYDLYVNGYDYTGSSLNNISGNFYFEFKSLSSSSSSSCPTCPTCPGINGQCSVSDKVSENLLYTGSVSLNSSSYTNIFNYGNNGAGTYCIKLTSSSAQTLTFGFTNSSTGIPTNLYQLYNDQYGNWVCLYGNKSYFNAKLNSSSNTVSYEIYKLTDLLSDDIPCEEVQGEECTQLKCENDYNLIPESSVTSEYCEENFNLIDPENCPASGGTGDVQWSSFFVNSHQVQGASNIYLWLPDFLNWDYTYVDSGSTLEIDVENEGDQEYIQSILDIQSYHPDKDQFAQSFAGFLTLLMPYIIITLFIIFIWRLIKRIFR